MRVLGWLASALGLLGVVFGNGLASVVWVIKLNIQARLRDLLAVPSGGLDIATSLTDLVAAGITEMSAQIGEVRQAADRLAQASTGDAAAAAELAAAIDTFVTGPYATFRSLYERLRERAVALGASLAQVGKTVPLANVPTSAVGRLQAIDARMVEIDGSVTYLSQLGVAGLVEEGVAPRVSERAAQAEETLAAVSQLMGEIDLWIEGARERLAERERRVSQWLNVSTVAASIAGLLFAGLNVLLFQQGRRWSSRR